MGSWPERAWTWPRSGAGGPPPWLGQVASAVTGRSRIIRYRWITDDRFSGPSVWWLKTKKPTLGVGFMLVVTRGIEHLFPL